MLVESFATIVGLINQFRAENGNKGQSDFNEFIEWLAQVHHTELKVYSGPQYIFMESSSNLEISEPRFLEDDLKSLIELNLLRHDLNSKGDNLYIFTRAASRLVSENNS